MNIATRQLSRKVPEITAIFWITKLLTTAMGEATSDFFVFKINPYVAVSLGGIFFVLVLILQLSIKKYIAWVYWLTVTMVAIFGTMAADTLHIQFKVPYTDTTILFAVILAIVFIMWQRTEKTLSIHSIDTSRRELFYWATVLATFALGTAVGDWSATTLGLGYFSSAFAFIGLILIPAIGYWLLHFNEIFAFWFAYVITRPIGASFSDWFSKSRSVGGLALGDGHVSIVLTIVIVFCVGYMTVSQRESKAEKYRTK